MQNFLAIVGITVVQIDLQRLVAYYNILGNSLLSFFFSLKLQFSNVTFSHDQVINNPSCESHVEFFLLKRKKPKSIVTRIPLKQSTVLARFKHIKELHVAFSLTALFKRSLTPPTRSFIYSSRLNFAYTFRCHTLQRSVHMPPVHCHFFRPPND